MRYLPLATCYLILAACRLLLALLATCAACYLRCLLPALPATYQGEQGARLKDDAARDDTESRVREARAAVEVAEAEAVILSRQRWAWRDSNPRER